MKKRRLICCMLVLVLCLSVCGVAFARQASGSCYISNSGRNVSFSGFSDSGQTENQIGVRLRLMEKRGSTWYEVGSASKSANNSDFVSASGSKSVTGGYYYKVIGTYTSSMSGTSYSTSSETSMVWIP